MGITNQTQRRSGHRLHHDLRVLGGASLREKVSKSRAIVRVTSDDIALVLIRKIFLQEAASVCADPTQQDFLICRISAHRWNT
jgi:hypothetical protein